MPSKRYPVNIQFSDSGQSVKIVHKNKKTVAELVITDSDTNQFSKTAELIHKGFDVKEFQGDLFGLQANERIEDEDIVEDNIQ